MRAKGKTGPGITEEEKHSDLSCKPYPELGKTKDSLI